MNILNELSKKNTYKPDLSNSKESLWEHIYKHLENYIKMKVLKKDKILNIMIKNIFNKYL